MYVGATALFSICVLSQAASAGRYDFTVLKALPGRGHTVPLAINDRNEVVGTSEAGLQASGFFLKDGKYTLVPESQLLTAINDEGVAAGVPSTGTSADYVTYDSRTGTATNHTVVGKKNVYALQSSGLNKRGDLAGALIRGNRGQVQEAAIFYRSKANVIPSYYSAFAINDSGEALLAGLQGFAYYKNHKITPLLPPGAKSVYADFLSNDGAVGGTIVDQSNMEHGFLLTNSAYTLYDYPGERGTTVAGVGSAGQVVGSFVEPNGRHQVFVFSAGQYYKINLPGSTEVDIRHANATGSFVGYFYIGKKIRSFIAICRKSQQPCTE